MSADPVRADSASPRPGGRPKGQSDSDGGKEDRRWLGALLALGFGVPIVVALAVAIADPAHRLGALVIAALFCSLGTSLALVQRLRETQRHLQHSSARIETLMDLSWELRERDIPPAVNPAPQDAALPVATVSHELRTPLHGMLGLADLLAETELTAEQRAYVLALRQAGTSLSRLVDDLLDGSRIAAGQFTLEPEPTEIEPFVEQIAELLAPRAHEKSIGLATRVAPGLPAVRVDQGRLRQVLINLVGNAIRFTQDGAVRVSVVPAGRVEDGHIALTFQVEDSGLGIASPDRARIFVEFERASSDRSGSGLGLSISQRIVVRMGGHIAVSARPEGGSVFGFTLRLPVGGERSSPAPLASLPNRNVLIVARPTLEAEALSETLRAASGSVRIASTLVEAAGLVGAAAAAGQGYDLVLLDARLASDHRLTLARLQESAGSELPVVILLEPAERALAGALRRDGFGAYLIRPVRRSSLLRIVAQAIGGRHDFLADPADLVDPLPPRRATLPLQVMVVEDDPVTTLLTRAILERLGHEVREAGTAADARAIALAVGRPTLDLVIADLRLPDEDGTALIRGLRAADRGPEPLCIVAISGSGDPVTRLAAMEAGADCFLEKPVSPDSLRRAIGEALSGRREGASIRHQTA